MEDKRQFILVTFNNRYTCKGYDPEHFGLASMIAFGYKNRDHRPKTRRKMEEVLKVVD